ncbi:MAG TPA: XRE family transcriptional regulator [Clostridium sp.]|jgi:transcriptional regulator with XRE-family HTH domain|uniref:helix-turn-helix domain-containing protein n=1 Tax=Clostridium sp. TaxID=1506 RepID=UPI000E85B83E|nr:XRE family transcriptional regulator [Clostridium sp.]
MKKTNTINRQEMGIRIREKREKLDLTREKFAEIVDLSPLYIGQLERGERQMSLTALVKVANSLCVTTDYLIYGKGKCKNNENFTKEEFKEYTSTANKKKRSILHSLLETCSSKELNLIESMVKLILPYIR